MRLHLLPLLVAPFLLVSLRPAATAQPAPQTSSAAAAARSRLSPDLRQWAASAALPSESPRLVTVLLAPSAPTPSALIHPARGRNLGALTWVTGKITCTDLEKLASSHGVLSVVSADSFAPSPMPWPEQDDPLPDLPSASPAKPSSPALPSRSSIKVRESHNAPAAWALGFRGEGVTVAIVDSGVDFSHPDLRGAQARIPHGPYAGWPLAYDTISGYYFTEDPPVTFGPDTRQSASSTGYTHTLPVENVWVRDGVATAILTLNIASDPAQSTRVLFRWPHRSKSGLYRYSIHPDSNLFIALARQQIGYSSQSQSPPAILVADEAVAGVYDTVYVDMDCDADFFNDKPALRGDETVGVDLFAPDGSPGADGIWDLSAGLLAWISDGQHLPPGISVLYPGMGTVPAPGALLCWVGDKDGHGTACASLVAARGVITDPLARGVSNPQVAGGAQAGGVGGPVLGGMAPAAAIAAVQNGYQLPVEAWTLMALGPDGLPETGDEAHIVSNSWGGSSIIEDGWDSISRVAHELNRASAPRTVFLAATGNGGFGYGTACSPGGATILSVGAAVTIGSVRAFEMLGAHQYSYGNIQFFSNRGPAALGDFSPDVIALGSWGTAALPLNLSTGGGERAYQIFSGTSMACPGAAGVLALAAQAWQSQHAQWPDWRQSRDLLGSTARDLGNEAFLQGSGLVDAGRAAEAATRRTWSISPSQWVAGDYRGARHEAFASIAFPGDSFQQVFRIANPTTRTLEVFVQGMEWTRIANTSFTTSPPYMLTAANYPVVLRPLDAEIALHDPDFVRARLRFDYNVFDVNGDYSRDQRWGLAFLDWTDRNGSGRLWTDQNSDGFVGTNELEFDGIYSEFARMAYAYNTGTVIEATLNRDAISRRHDGIFLGILRVSGIAVSELDVSLDYFRKTSASWLSVPGDSLVVPPGETLEFLATVEVPPDAAPGAIQGAIQVLCDGRSTLVPVALHVAAPASGFRFGAASPQATPGPLPYLNEHVNGAFNWDWRYEAGDWRLFFFDVPTGAAPPGSALLVDTQWTHLPTDLDTWILGPREEALNRADPDFYGPATLRTVGGSSNLNIGSGIFRFETATGGPREMVGAPLAEGLHAILLHQVLNAGRMFDEPFTGHAFRIRTQPASLDLEGPSGTVALEFTSDAPIPAGIQVRAYGFSRPLRLPSTIRQDDPNRPCSSSFVYPLPIASCGLLEISTTSTVAMDIDLFVYRDNRNGVFDCSPADVVAASSTTPEASEFIRMLRPADGLYWIAVHGWSVPGNSQPFKLNVRALQGASLVPISIPQEPIEAGVPVHMEFAWNLPRIAEDWQAVVFIGPPEAPTVIQVPVTLQVPDTGSTGWQAR